MALQHQFALTTIFRLVSSTTADKKITRVLGSMDYKQAKKPFADHCSEQCLDIGIVAMTLPIHIRQSLSPAFLTNLGSCGSKRKERVVME